MKIARIDANFYVKKSVCRKAIIRNQSMQSAMNKRAKNVKKAEA